MYLKGTRPITASPAVGCGQCVCVALPSRAAAQIPRRGASAAQSTSAAGASVGRGPGPLASGSLPHFHLQQQAEAFLLVTASAPSPPFVTAFLTVHLLHLSF